HAEFEQHVGGSRSFAERRRVGIENFKTRHTTLLSFAWSPACFSSVRRHHCPADMAIIIRTFEWWFK
ncbi:MAG: hypothetical protein KGQ47_17315, partial [Hyphomicrobiales bacterium]|nr:hypothetical protein [Hyphomicrobiales bacterium]